MLKPRVKRCLKQATLFKLEYWFLGGESKEVQEREFNNLKSLRQWAERYGESISVIPFRTWALIDSVWEPFATIGKKSVLLSDLERIVRDLREDISAYKDARIEDFKSSKTEK